MIFTSGGQAIRVGIPFQPPASEKDWDGGYREQ